MLTKFFGFYSLAACVAAAVVGIELFVAPMESAQGQLSGSGMITVTEVDLDSFSFVSAGELNMSLSVSGSYSRIPVFLWSGIYGDDDFWNWLSVTGTREDIELSRAVLGPAQLSPYYYPGNRGDYYVCRFGSLDLDAADSGSFSIDED